LGATPHPQQQRRQSSCVFSKRQQRASFEVALNQEFQVDQKSFVGVEIPGEVRTITQFSGKGTKRVAIHGEGRCLF
jgi:hypothetical protein